MSARRNLAVAAGVLLVLVVLPALYVLSFAPACSLRRDGKISWETFDTIYAPVQFVAERSPAVKRRMVAYHDWWFGEHPKRMTNPCQGCAMGAPMPESAEFDAPTKPANLDRP